MTYHDTDRGMVTQRDEAQARISGEVRERKTNGHGWWRDESKERGGDGERR